MLGNTRPVRTNTADRAPNTLMAHRYVRMLVCTVCFQWNIQTNPVQPSEQRKVETTDDGAGETTRSDLGMLPFGIGVFVQTVALQSTGLGSGLLSRIPPSSCI